MTARTRARIESVQGAAVLESWLESGERLDEAAARDLLVRIVDDGGAA